MANQPMIFIEIHTAEGEMLADGWHTPAEAIAIMRKAITAIEESAPTAGANDGMYMLCESGINIGEWTALVCHASRETIEAECARRNQAQYEYDLSDWRTLPPCSPARAPAWEPTPTSSARYYVQCIKVMPAPQRTENVACPIEK